MNQLKEEHDGALNDAKDNGTTENIEELDKLRQNPEDKKFDVMEICDEQDMLMDKLKALQHSFNEERKNQRKEPKPSKYNRNT